MGELTEGDIKYISGTLDGVLLAACFETSEDTGFDEEKWKELYGKDVIFSDIPAYPSEEAKRKQEDGLTIMDWDNDRDIAVLVSGAELPTDRTGNLVFEDGTVVSNRLGEWKMFSLSDPLFALVESLKDRRLEIIRDVYNFDPARR